MTTIVQAPPRREVPLAAPDRLTVRTISVTLVALVLTQRLGIPFADAHVPLALPIALLGVGTLVVGRRVRIDRLRGELWLVATIAVLGVTAITGLTGTRLSVPSLILLLLIYLPWMLVARSGGRAGAEQIGRVFVYTMVPLALIGVAQLATQLTDMWSYEDWLAGWVSPDLLIGDYNTHIPLVYDSPDFKANAFVMLEPSFLSQFCALAVIVGLMVRVRAWMLLVLVAGVASAVSGTGIILLIAGAVLVLFRAPGRIRPLYLLAIGGGLALLWYSPVAPLLLERAGETSQRGTSGYQRFVQPYTEVLQGLAEEPSHYLVGAGAGSAERLLASDKGGVAGEAVVYTVVPKLAFEYGLIAGGLFLLLIVFSLLHRAPWRVVPGALVVMTFVLTGGLHQPATAFLAFFLSGFWTAGSCGPSETDPPEPGTAEEIRTRTAGGTSPPPAEPASARTAIPRSTTSTR